METTAVTRFRGEYEFLSNFYSAKLLFDGLPYQNAEAAYQAQKCADPRHRKQFSATYPDEAKRLGRTVTVREDWEQVKLSVMEQVVRAKFEQNPRLVPLLIATGEMPLLEGNTWDDLYWGVDLKTLEGQNHLGRILMDLRQEYRVKGCPDRSNLRPVQQKQLAENVLATDESVADLSVDCIVWEAEKKSPDRPPVGQAFIRFSTCFDGPPRMITTTPVYGRDDGELLLQCCQNCLDLAAAQGFRSIVFPALAIGTSCFPKKIATRLMVEGITLWNAAHPDASLDVILAPEDIRCFEYFTQI